MAAIDWGTNRPKAIDRPRRVPRWRGQRPVRFIDQDRGPPADLGRPDLVDRRETGTPPFERPAAESPDGPPSSLAIRKIQPGLRSSDSPPVTTV